MLFFANHLFKNLFANSIALYTLQPMQIFYQNSITVAEIHAYGHCSEICSDIILMPQFLEIVRNIF